MKLQEKRDEVDAAEVLQKLQQIKSEYAAVVAETHAIQEAQKNAMSFFKEELTGLCDKLVQLQQHTNLPQAEGSEEVKKLNEMLGMPDRQCQAVAPQHSPDAVFTEPGFHTPEMVEEIASKLEQTKVHGEEPSVEQSAYDLRASCQDCMDITEKEFMSVSSLVRGRVKLTEVNQTYRTLWKHFREDGNSEPLNASAMYKMGLRVTGQTGEAKLKVLRSLKLLSISKKGEVLLL